MKKLAVLISLLLLPAFSFAQDYDSYEDPDTGREIRKQYFENGNTRYEAAFENGKAEGIARLYFEDGDIYCEASYKNGVLNGKTTVYTQLNEYRLEIDYSGGMAVDGYLVQTTGSKRRLTKAQLKDWNQNKPVHGFVNRISYFI